MSDENTPSIAQNGPQESTGDDSGTDGPAKREEASEQESQKDRYITELRAEAKENRLKAAHADFLNTEVRRLAVREAARLAGLTDPEALGWDDAWTTKDGLPDHDQLLATAEALAASKPWLARPRGPLPGQGQHSAADEGLSLSALLRA